MAPRSPYRAVFAPNWPFLYPTFLLLSILGMTIVASLLIMINSGDFRTASALRSFLEPWMVIVRPLPQSRSAGFEVRLGSGNQRASGGVFSTSTTDANAYQRSCGFASGLEPLAWEYKTEGSLEGRAS
jgi:hypothetical protein